MATSKIAPERLLAGAMIVIGVGSAIVAATTLAPQAATGGGRWFVAGMNLGYWWTWSALLPLIAWTVRAIKRANLSSLRFAAAHACAALACAAAHLAALMIANELLSQIFLGRTVPAAALWRNLWETPRLLIEWELTMYAAVAVAAHASLLQRALHDGEAAEAALRTSLVEARLLSLQRQLQPHFLFNTLHAISALLRHRPDAAETMIEELSGLLRAALNRDSSPEVSLDEDLGILDHYIAIERAQMAGRLNVSVDVPADARRAAVPTLLLQPIVENAVRHGLQPRASGGNVTISARIRGDQLRIQVDDDGVGTTIGAGAGVGLTNTSGRLRQLYGDQQQLTVSPRPGGGTSVRIDLPVRAS